MNLRRESRLNLFIEEYNEEFFKKGLEALERNRPIFEAATPVFHKLNQAWGFKVFPEYQLTLTKYGPGGMYLEDTGRVVMLTDKNGMFKRKNQAHTPVHEMVHMGIEERLVKRFDLTHWEKERVVDLMTQKLFGHLMPNYEPQDRGLKIIDPYVTAETIWDLPSSMEKFASDYPR